MREMTDDFHMPEKGAGDDTAPDPRLAEALRALDPASRDPGYWPRFHRSVMAAAGDELARRRMLADVTIGDLMTSWSRTLVPASVLAAAVAAFVILQSGAAGTPASGPLALDEMLSDEFEGEVFRPVSDDPVVDVTFAAEGF